jgi:peptide chain release factor subunit 1
MSTWGNKESVHTAAAKDDGLDTAIEQWKLRRLIRQLESAKGAGTSMISLIVPPKDDINRINKLLTEEYGTASSIKSRVNRLSVLGAITSTQQRLKMYTRTPPNGLILYCGEIITDDGKEKKLTIDFEPFKPIGTTLYLCDNKFHCEDIAELLESDDKFGFLIMDGNGALYGTVAGNHREVLHKFSVELPKKHGRGGQSALRFARLRLEKRHNYVRKVSEIATQCFITDAKPNITGLILAGSADFKTELTTSDLWDARLEAILIKPMLDIAYGGENGFNQAIELSSETLKNVKFIQEKKLITKFLDEVAQDTGKYCFGIKDTMQALDMGAVETLIVWENLDLLRLVIKNPHTDVEKVEFLTTAESKNEKLYRDQETGHELTVEDNLMFVEWIVQNYKTFGAKLEFVTDRSQEGNQFCKGFGGIGGLMRYRVEFEVFDDDNLPASDSDDDFM